MIEYFTKNYHNEIGAFGIGKVNKDGSILIEKLVFTKQTVNSVHVAIKPEDWGELIKELSMKDLQNIIFYWHKHPDGSCSSSQGDEDDTYDLLMDEETGKRELMAFLVTSNINGRMECECRIEMRKPIKASIDADFMEEEDLTYEEKCKKILEKNVNKEKKTAIKDLNNVKVCDYSTYNKPVSDVYMESEPITIYMKSGMFILMVEKTTAAFVETFLEQVKHLTSSVIKKEIKGGVRFSVTPTKDCYSLLKTQIQTLYDGIMADEIKRQNAVEELVQKQMGWYDGYNY
jgi:proteasome lid subunit RPN8/RPN11